LLDKGVVCPTNCASCDSNQKDLKYVFFDCPFAIQVWNRTITWRSIQHAISTSDSVTDAIFSLLEQLSVDLAQRSSTIFWSIWKHRNLRVWDNVTETNATVVERARNMVVDWQLANTSAILASATHHQPSPTLDLGASTSAQPVIPMWQHPSPG
jgi:hypothetical protein